MTRETPHTSDDEKPEGIEFPEGGAKPSGRKAKPDGAGRPRAQKAKVEEPTEPLPDETKPAPGVVPPLHKDAAKAFMEATSSSQAFAVATAGLLGAVRFGLPDADVHFKVKPVEEVINLDGSKSYLNQAIVSLYKLPEGARMGPTEPRLWLVAEHLVPAFKERKSKIIPHQLRLAVDRQGTPYLLPVPLGARDIWGSSLATCVKLAETMWIKMFSDSKKGRLHDPGDEQTLKPSWPVEDFATIYMLALMPVYIDNKEHEIYKRICGA
jgi:hypothetical protein